MCVARRWLRVRDAGGLLSRRKRGVTDVNHSKAERGMTLVELTLAVAIFVMVLGATAQSLISYYVALDIQDQRVVATRHCVGVLNTIRDFRGTTTDPFPAAITDQWVDGSEVPGVASLPQENVIVTYTNPASNPLEVVVVSTWKDLRGRQITAQVSTVLTNQ
jgi:type II secretory pathway pseudopilin PulG